MRRKGFTLIELLAVIVILAIIALIATPMIMDVIENSRRGAAIESVNGIIESAETYRAEKLIDQEEYVKTVDLKGDILKYKGSKPDSGTLRFNQEGKIYVLAKYKNYCIEKGYNDLKPTIVDSEKCQKEPVLSAGYSTVMMIDKDENLWGWGLNNYGQLGDGTAEDKAEPIQIKAGTKFQSVTTGAFHTMAIDVEGNLWGWGQNNVGQLGDGTTEDKTEPVLIKEETQFQSVSVGHSYTIAIDIEGNLWGWGQNNTGQLGDGTTENRITPIQIKEGTKFQGVSAGVHYTMAIDEEGNLWGWGNNDYGQLGFETERYKYSPYLMKPSPTLQQVKEGTRFKSVSAGFTFTMAIDAEGNLWGFGDNGASGLLGAGSMSGSTIPKQIKEGTKFKSVSASFSSSQNKGHIMAIDEEGNLWGWGYNGNGQLGDGTKDTRLYITPIKAGTKFVNVQAGNNYSIALDEKGELYTFGTVN